MTGFVREYQFSLNQRADSMLAIQQMHAGMTPVLLLSGVPGSGKTSYSSAMAVAMSNMWNIEVPVFHHQCTPDNEQDLLYTHDIDGIIKRSNAWRKGPAWAAFEHSHHGPCILLIDEIDKSLRNFEAYILRLLENFEFEIPSLDEYHRSRTTKAKKENLMIIITSNDSRPLRPETLRRCQRIPVPFPESPRLESIIRDSLKERDMVAPERLIDLVVRIGKAIRTVSPEEGMAPKEMAYLIFDLMNLNMLSKQNLEFDNIDVWQHTAMKYVAKTLKPHEVDKILKMRWVRALMNETKRGVVEEPENKGLLNKIKSKKSR